MERIYSKVIGYGALILAAIVALYDVFQNNLGIFSTRMALASAWVVLPYLLFWLLSIKLYRAQNRKWGGFAAVYSVIISVLSFVAYREEDYYYVITSAQTLVLLIAVAPLVGCNILLNWEKLAGIVRDLRSGNVQKIVVVRASIAVLLLGVAGYFLAIALTDKRSAAEAMTKVDPDWQNLPGTTVVGAPQAPQNVDLKRYFDYLADLDKYDPVSIISAREYLTKEFANKDEAVTQDALRMLVKLYSEVIPLCNDLKAQREAQAEFFKQAPKVLKDKRDPVDAILASTDPVMVAYKSKNKVVVDWLRDYRAAGIKFVGYSGGDDTEPVTDAEYTYLETDPEYLVALAADFRGQYADFLSFYYSEIEQKQLAYDAGLLVGWDVIGSRLARWEKFARKHPDLPETASIIKPEIIRLVALFTGTLEMPNTPIVERETGRPQAGVLEAYGTFLKENPDSEHYQEVKSAYDKYSALERK